MSSAVIGVFDGYDEAQTTVNELISAGFDQQEISLHESLVEDSKRSATLAYVGLGVGSVAMLGAVLLYTSSAGGETEERPPSGRVRAAPHVAADGSWGATLIGSF